MHRIYHLPCSRNIFVFIFIPLSIILGSLVLSIASSSHRKKSTDFRIMSILQNDTTRKKEKNNLYRKHYYNNLTRNKSKSSIIERLSRLYSHYKITVLESILYGCDYDFNFAKKLLAKTSYSSRKYSQIRLHDYKALEKSQTSKFQPYILHKTFGVSRTSNLQPYIVQKPLEKSRTSSFQPYIVQKTLPC